MLIMTSNRREQGKPEAVAFRAVPAVALEGSVVAEVIVASCAGIAGTLTPVPLAHLHPCDSTARSPVWHPPIGVKGARSRRHVRSHAPEGHLLDRHGEFPVLQLAHVRIPVGGGIVLSLAESSACGRSGS